MNDDICENNNMSVLENFKIKIVNTHLDLYKKFPTLHSIRCHYSSSSMGLSKKGWNSRVNQVAWDTVEKIDQEEDYKSEGLIMYAYLSNGIGKMKNEDLISMVAGNTIVKIKYDELQFIVKNEPSYLNDMEMELRKQLISQQEDKNHSLSINLSSRDWYGHKCNFKKEIDFFLDKKWSQK